MKTLSELTTSNLAEVVKNTKIKNPSTHWGLIEEPCGIPYINIYSLLYTLKNERKHPPMTVVKMVTECVVYLNEDIDERLLQEAVRFYIREYVFNDYDSKFGESLISEVLSRKSKTLLQATDAVRYIFKEVKMTDEQMIYAIIKHRTKNIPESEFAKMTSYFHALIDTQNTNWVEICEEDFCDEFPKKLVKKHFTTIFKMIHYERQKALKKLLQKNSKIAA